MSSNLKKFEEDLNQLILLGTGMSSDLSYRHLKAQGKLPKEHEEFAAEILHSFERRYQDWYTQACAVIRQIIPDRLEEFVSLYKGDGKRKEIDSRTYSIQDWLNGIRAGTNATTGKSIYDDFAIVSMRMQTQLAILKSVKARFTSSLFDIRQLVLADLFDSELDAARELVKHGFGRGAGAIGGVVLEKHLAQVAANHSITTRKKHPTISDFNDLLKSSEVLDVPTWRQIQRLGDIRNLCDHSKDRAPTDEEVSELIDGVEKITKTIF